MAQSAENRLTKALSMTYQYGSLAAANDGGEAAQRRKQAYGCNGESSNRGRKQAAAAA